MFSNPDCHGHFKSNFFFVLFLKNAFVKTYTFSVSDSKASAQVISLHCTDLHNIFLLHKPINGKWSLNLFRNAPEEGTELRKVPC